MECTIISRKIENDSLNQEIILQVGNEEFLLYNPNTKNLPISKEESERLIKILAKEETKVILSNKGCNFHIDCQQANEIAKSKGKLWAEHCSDESCEDCFGT